MIVFFKYLKVAFLLVVLSVFRHTSCFSQQELNLHFMDRVIQSNSTNPALFTKDKLVIAAPGIAYNYGNNAFTYRDLIKPSGGRNILDVDNVLGKLQRHNILQNQLNIDLIRGQVRFKNMYLTFIASEKMNIKFGYSKDLIDFLWNGNSTRVGDTLSIGPSINARYYREVGVGLGTRIGKWTFGARTKILFGLADLYTENNKITIYSDPEAYQTTISTHYTFNASGEDKFLEKPLRGAVDFNNRGMAVDLGTTYQPNSSWTLAASLTNMGFITWRKNTSNYRSKETFSYSGMHLNKYFEMDTFKTKHLVDTLKATFFPVRTSSSYTSYQVARAYVSARYEISTRYTAGMLAYFELVEEADPAMSVYLLRRFGKSLDVGVSYAMKNQLFNNFGMSATLTRRRLQGFFVSDNIANVFRIKHSRNVNFRVGVNFILRE